MALFESGNNFENKTSNHPDNESPQTDQTSTSKASTSTNDHGLSPEEFSDPNKISVEISDKEAPIVVFYGPPACGKTMTLVRLARYLHSKGFKVEPVADFRPFRDSKYQNLCANFGRIIDSQQAADSTPDISFLLSKISDSRGRLICQMLEAPGEHYFFPKNPAQSYPAYINKIIAEPNRKLWVFMLEPHETNKEMTVELRRSYARRINDFCRNIQFKDKVLFLFNKIDATNYVKSGPVIDEREAIRGAGNLYPNIFVPFENRNPITKLFRRYDCEFVGFQTGWYNATNDEKLTYTEGPECYPEMLWAKIRSIL